MVRLFFILFFSLCINRGWSQELNQHDLLEGQVYVMDENWLSTASKIFKVKSKKFYAQNDMDYSSSVIDNKKSFSGNTTVCSKTLYNIRKADGNEKAWMEECIRQNKLIPWDEFASSRGLIKQVSISLNRQSFLFKGEKDGWQFSNVPFRYQFVNCGGEVQMGINYDRKAQFISLIHKGEIYYSSANPDLWPKSHQIEIGDVKADLYYGKQRLGTVELKYIVGNFAGCFGETFQVLKDVGLDPSKKEYKESLNLFSLQNVEITRGGVTIGYGNEQKIIKSVAYDEFGNPKDEKKSEKKKKYDAFGREIKE